MKLLKISFVAFALFIILVTGVFLVKKKYLDKPKCEVLDLWQGNPPTSNGLEGLENPVIEGVWIENVCKAEMFLYKANNKKDGRAVIICPSGAYEGLSLMYDGTAWAEWLQSKGITAVTLKYRSANEIPEVPLEDMRQAVKYLFDNAEELKIDRNKIGFWGASAGGHLATYAAFTAEEGFRPDFLVLFYPVVTMNDKYGSIRTRNALLGKDVTEEDIERYSVENLVTEHSPRTYIMYSDDDLESKPINGEILRDSLLAKGVDVTLKTYPEGGHGWGTKAEFKYSKEMTASLAEWLDNLY